MESNEGTFLAGVLFLLIVWYLANRGTATGGPTLSVFGSGIGSGPFAATSVFPSMATATGPGATNSCGC